MPSPWQCLLSHGPAASPSPSGCGHGAAGLVSPPTKLVCHRCCCCWSCRGDAGSLYWGVGLGKLAMVTHSWVLWVSISAQPLPLLPGAI